MLMSPAQQWQRCQSNSGIMWQCYCREDKDTSATRASYIHIGHIQNVWGSSLTQIYRPYLAQNLVIWVTCGVKMMSLGCGWSCHPIQAAFSILIRHMQSVWAHWYAVHRHKVQLYPPYLAQILVIWDTCGVKMMSLGHGWSWHPIQTAFSIHIRHMLKA